MTIHESAILIQALKTPGLYHHPVRHCQVLETHISWVILTGQYAYKIKKPVDFGFVDFSTLEKRHVFCLEEVRLNTRLAPELYLGVVPISGTPAHPILYSADQPIEYAVHMRQFPVEATLDQVVARGELEFTHLDQLAIDIARFHQKIAAEKANNTFGTPQIISKVVHEVIEHFTGKPDRLVPSISYQKVIDWVIQEHERLTPRFASRKDQGFVRECHGDMHLANLVLIDDHVVPFDGIEFSERLRWIDVMNDLAFPVMDSIARGQSDGAYRLLNTYLEHTGDYEGLHTFRYYQVYRALVRAKVASLNLDQSENQQPYNPLFTEQLRRYLSVAQESITSRTPGMVLMHGVSGSGKTTISQSLLESIGAIRVRSDVERKRLFGNKGTAKHQRKQHGRMYGEQANEETYQRLYELAGSITKAGFTVIVDATFLQERFRSRFRQLAADSRIPFVILDIQASPATLAERVTARVTRGQDASDADVPVMVKQRDTQDPITRPEMPYVIRVNSEKSFDSRVVCARLAGSGW